MFSPSGCLLRSDPASLEKLWEARAELNDDVKLNNRQGKRIFGFADIIRIRYFIIRYFAPASVVSDDGNTWLRVKSISDADYEKANVD